MHSLGTSSVGAPVSSWREAGISHAFIKKDSSVRVYSEIGLLAVRAGFVVVVAIELLEVASVAVNGILVVPWVAAAVSYTHLTLPTIYSV